MLQITRGFFDAGLGRFLISPGFGGASALLGGVLAYLAAQRKTRTDRENERQKRWWDALTWVYDRATAERLDARLSPSLTLDMLERLLDEADTELEVQAVLGLLGLFADETETG